MRKSLAKIYFDSKPCDRDLLKMEWLTVTIDQKKPNNWSIRIIFVEELQADNSVLAKIDFLMEDANYLLASG
jgi:hypothetical protein